jgi:paraquat-inducible protein B
MEEAIVKKKSGISVIWILPLVALLVGGWIAYKSYQDKGVMIQVAFDEINGVTAGKTQVMHKGLPIGLVKEYTIDYKKHKIYLDIEMVKEVKPFLFEDLKFWIVRPEVSAARITGLDTLLSGSYIAVKPGKSGKLVTKFEGLSEPPPIPEQSIAYHLHLTATSKDSLSVGAPLLFKKMKVGEIVSIKFKKDSSNLDVGVVVYKQFAQVVSADSYFWNASGLRITASFENGLEMQLGSMQTLITGGIAFATPPDSTPLKTDNAAFPLYKNQDDAEDSVLTKIYFSFVDPAGIKIGTAIKFKGVEIGEISKIDMNETMENVTAEAIIRKKAKNLFTADSQFWVENKSLSLNNLGSVQQIMAGAYISMVSGKDKFNDHFVVAQSAPKLLKADNELIIVLHTPRLGSLNVGSPVLYRQIVVGEVTSFNLSETGQYVEVYVKILAPYTPLVHEESKFYLASGIRVEGGLMTTMKIATESLESLVTGGIAFVTPNNDAMGKQAETGHQFTLHEDIGDDWLKWSPEFSLHNVINTPHPQSKLPTKITVTDQ